jgi:hypothetical protein
MGSYRENLNLNAELVETQGYYFKVFDYHFIVHKYQTAGWRVSELSTGCGITHLCPTRREALKCFAEMQEQKYDGLDFFTTLKQRIPDTIKIYGKIEQ